ncbi:MAG: hypothetical protein KDD40_00655 [Bdellovibrionales bacterium]|nr:hypothetical protein [Bdellovibrionales bacterium]
MKSILFLHILLFGFSKFSSADEGTLVIDGKPYIVSEKELRSCGHKDSPEFNAAEFGLIFARQNGEEVFDLACTSKAIKDCNQEAKVKFGLQQMFAIIRSFPSSFHSESCQVLRNKCTQSCIEANVYEKDVCLIECNQYESYNR